MRLGFQGEGVATYMLHGQTHGPPLEAVWKGVVQAKVPMTNGHPRREELTKVYHRKTFKQHGKRTVTWLSVRGGRMHWLESCLYQL